MPNQFSAIDIFNVLHCTPGLSVDVEYVCVCMKKKILREDYSQSRVLCRVEQSYNTAARDIEIALLCILINTNEQGLAEIVLTIFRMWGMG